MLEFPFIVPSGSGSTEHGYHIAKVNPEKLSTLPDIPIVQIPRTQEDLGNVLDNLSKKQTEQLKEAGLI